VRFPCVHAAATTPAQRLVVLLRSSNQPYQPSPEWPLGRPAHRPFRGLLSVHSRCGLHTRAVTVIRDTPNRRLQTYRHLHACSGCFRLERLPGGACTRWKAPPLHGARHFQSFDRSGNRDTDDRFQSTAAIGQQPLERSHSPMRTLTVSLPRSTSDAPSTSAVRSTELALPTQSGCTPRGLRRPKADHSPFGPCDLRWPRGYGAVVGGLLARVHASLATTTTSIFHSGRANCA
jgi:hypothetical protein